MGDLVRVFIVSILLMSIGCGVLAGEEPSIVLENGHQSLLSDFRADATSGQVPALIQFYDTSTGSPGEWLWNFGDGDQATVQNPLHIYMKPGVYSVSLTITGPTGSDRKTRLGYITVNPGSDTAVPQTEIVTPVQTTTPLISSPEILTLTQTPEPTITVLPTITSLSTPSPSPDNIPSIPSSPEQTPVPSGTLSERDLLNLFGEEIHANFNTSSPSGMAPLTVSFTDKSTGTPKTWLWDFGDGNTSDQASPQHTYADIGNYCVKLTVTSSGGSDSIIGEDAVQVTPVPAASFLAQPYTGSVPLTVAFTDNSSGRRDSWLWDFGDGATSQEQNPVHMYGRPGVFAVSLHVNGPDGSADKSIPSLITVTERIEPPKASIGVDTTTGQAPLTIKFTDTSTGDVTTRDWDFGDGSTGSEITPSHTYQKAGTYTATLHIKGPAGESHAETSIVVAESIPAPVAGISAFPLSGVSPLTVQFSDSSSGDVTTRSWDFGDGEVSSDVSPSHTYATSGKYPVILTVRGPGGEDRSMTNVSVETPISQPVAGFSVSPQSGVAPLSVQFTDSSSGDVTSRKWSFGDGEESSEVSPSHTFTASGKYPVVLTVTGPGGESHSTTNVSVESPAIQPIAGFSATPLSGVAPLTVQFTDSSSGDVTSRSWDFGDGEVSSDVSPSHTYTASGKYEVVLTVTGPGGENRSSTNILIEIPVLPPVAGFSASPLSGIAPLTVQFTDSSSGEVNSRSWDFGDREVSSEVSPVHTYSITGSYPVVLKVSGPGGENTTQMVIQVKEEVVPILTSFTTNVKEGLVPLTVQFSDTSTGKISSQSWNFGDGASGTGLITSHTYTQPGTYTATLTTQSEAGENTADRIITVTKPAGIPNALFTADPSAGTPPLMVSFTDISTGDIESREWTFGDGTTGTGKSPSHTYPVAGQYQVTLKVDGPSGEDSYQATVMVTEKALPFKAGFTLTKNEGTAPLTVSFTDASTGAITSRTWDFGDGSSSIEQNPTHTYSAAGNYPVSLTIQGPEGEKRSDISLIMVTSSVTPPRSLFTPNSTTGSAPMTIAFADGASGDITRRSWNFGDGSSSIEQSPVHTYTMPGMYEVTYKVQGPAGESSSAKTITVKDSVSTGKPGTDTNISKIEGPLTPPSDASGSSVSEPTQDFIAGEVSPANQTDATSEPEIIEPDLILAPEPTEVPSLDFSSDVTTGLSPLMVTFHSSGANEGDGYFWDLGDGNVSYDAEPVHLYTDPGTYDVVLTISGTSGDNTQVKTGYITVNKEGQALSADFSSDLTSGPAPLQVTFFVRTDAPIDRYEWLFGDGTSSGEPRPVHNYVKPGKYDVTLTVSGPDGKDTQVYPAYIKVGPETAPIQVLVHASPSSGTAPLVVNFSSDITAPVQSYYWDFGDGTNSSEQIPNHTYFLEGSYNVSLQVQGASGTAKGDLRVPVTVNANTPPISHPLHIQADILNGTAPLKVSFTSDTEGSVDGYAWDFGDGGSSYEQNPVHVYNIPGNYSVKLVIAGKDGSSDVRLPETITVHEGEKIPVGGFSAYPVSGYVPLTVTFTDLSTGTNRDYLWDFGDGNTSSDANPTHVYTSPGIYPITQRVINLAGSSEEVKEDYITVQERPASPVALFKSDLRIGSAPFAVNFSDFSSGKITNWTWDLGDDSQSNEQNPAHTYTRPGVYSITLTVSGPGGENTAVRRGFITVNKPYSPPVAAMYGEPLMGKEPLTVKFLDLSTGTVTGWVWDFGDGMTSTNKNPTHTFYEAGTYQVQLEATGPVGSSRTEVTVEVTSRDGSRSTSTEKKIASEILGNRGISETDSSSSVSTGKPMANFTISRRNGPSPLEISFEDHSTGEITRWNWDFGDNSISDLPNPTHTYEQNGVYTVSLMVEGPDGRSSKRIRDAIDVI